ncbi:helix-turn-helix transcriptional regulator [Marisediminicola sp. LYQ134]|uniref:helix-turn-helix transcriptional regulator n=1 Tax=Marisediminicola sp. LYQ134 TaxID=3391061 RepID=UPI00398356A3
MTRDRAALGEFLRSRRDRLTPSTAGIEAFPGPRRVPGLRKEELAVLAGVSPDYYSRLEQGRQATISREVLDSLARALRLDDVERAHLHDLAAPARRAPMSTTTTQHADPGLLRLMTAVEHLPALIIGQRAEVLARNALLATVLHDLPVGSSLARFMFLDPVARERIVNWETFASTTVASLRRDLARHPHDRRLAALVDDLRAADADAERWWNDHGVRDYASVAKKIRHPLVGELEFDLEIVTAPHDPEQRLIVYTAERGSPTERMLPVLASWDADPAPTAPRASDRSGGGRA